jgi:hypothetical protein
VGRATAPRGLGEQITQHGCWLRVVEAVDEKNLGGVGLLEREDATFTAGQHVVRHRRFAPARERIGAKPEDGRPGTWPGCGGEGESPREDETQEGSDPSLGLTARRWMRDPAWSNALKAV